MLLASVALKWRVAIFMHGYSGLVSIAGTLCQKATASTPPLPRCPLSNGSLTPNVQDQPSLDRILPRHVRTKRRPMEDRGLPPDEELKKLARIYLDRQRKLWPECIALGVLPVPTESVLEEMAAAFKVRHRTAKIDSSAIRTLENSCRYFGGFYGRYSCDNSDPKSITDQLVNSLEKAKQEGRFIPWCYVFSDYSVSGLTSCRIGYQLCRNALCNENERLDTVYIDDFTRASRDTIEWWFLAERCRSRRKRLIGASDGFNLDSADWEMKVGMYSLLSKLFVKGLREKVIRGMRGTARGGGTLGKPPLGFTRRPKKDKNGQPIPGTDGQSKTEYCHDPQTTQIVLDMYEKLVNLHWTPHQIAIDLNERKVDGWEGWTGESVRIILRNPAYIGVFIWNRKHREFDLERNAWKTIKNPRNEWIVFYDRNLAMVSHEIWKSARKILELTSHKWRIHRTKNRSASDAKGIRVRRQIRTLFQTVLRCGYCNQSLTLYRSSGKFRDVHCKNGHQSRHGCRLRTSKAVNIIERSLLDYIRSHLFTKDVIRQTVERANELLTEEAKKPQKDLRPLQARLRDIADKRRRLIGLVERTDDAGLIKDYEQRLKDLQKQANEIQRQITEGQRDNQPTPPPLDSSRVEAYLQDLRSVLQQDTAVAAEAIAALTGPILIRQEAIAGRKRGARWIASFQPDFLALLAKIGGAKNYPDSVTLEYLTDRKWIIVPRPVEVQILGYFRYLQHVDAARKMLNAGASINAIASGISVTWPTAKAICDFIKTGQGPKWKPGGKRAKKPGEDIAVTVPKFKQIAADVARLKDLDKMPIPKMISWFKKHRGMSVSSGTVQRAWDEAHREDAKEAALHGIAPPQRAAYTHIEETKKRRIRQLLKCKNVAEIAMEVGCSVSTVNRELANSNADVQSHARKLRLDGLNTKRRKCQLDVSN